MGSTIVLVVGATFGARCWSDLLSTEVRWVRVDRRGARIGHAPFRRVIELAVASSLLVTVSFPGRACHPLTV